MKLIIIGISGPTHSGKSEAAKHLIENYGFRRTAFADPIKKMLMVGLGLTYEQVYGNEKEIPTDKLCGHTPRFAMKTLGTEWGRDTLHRDLWLNRWKETMKDEEGRLLIEDLRFPNELEAIQSIPGGSVLRIQRPGRNYDASHESEAHALRFDYLLQNDGTLEEMRKQLDELCRRIDIR